MPAARAHEQQGPSFRRHDGDIREIEPGCFSTPVHFRQSTQDRKMFVHAVAKVEVAEEIAPSSQEL